MYSCNFRAWALRHTVGSTLAAANALVVHASISVGWKDYAQIVVPSLRHLVIQSQTVAQMANYEFTTMKMYNTKDVALTIDIFVRILLYMFHSTGAV